MHLISPIVQASIIVAVFLNGLIFIAIARRRNAINKYNNELTSALRRLETKNLDLEYQTTSLQACSAKLTNDNSEFAVMNASLLLENAKLRSSIRTKDTEGWDLTNQIRFKAEELKNLTRELAERIASMEALQLRVDEGDRDIETYCQLAANKELELQAIRRNMSGTIHALTSQIQEIVEAKSDWEKHAKYFHVQLENMTTLQAQTERKNQELEEHIASLVWPAEDLRDENDVEMCQDDLEDSETLLGWDEEVDGTW